MCAGEIVNIRSAAFRPGVGLKTVAGNLLCSCPQNSVASKRNGAYAHDIQPFEVGEIFASGDDRKGRVCCRKMVH